MAQALVELTEQEFEALTSPAVKQALVSSGFKRIAFSEL